MGEIRGIIWLIGLAGLVWVIWQWAQCRRVKVGAPAQTMVERALRPRTPEDCSACREQSHLAGQRAIKEPVQPWSEVKSRRGRRKRLNTAGYACVNKDCQYYGITDASVHALVGGGGHGQRERIKVYRRRRLVRIAYRMRLGQLSELIAKLRDLHLGQVLNTAFVERVNLTLRQGVPALIRRTWSTAQEQDELSLHLEWWRGYYHFVRPHQNLRLELPQPRERCGQRLPQRYRSRTPAMAAGVTRHRWTVEEFLKLPLPPAVS